MVKANSEMKNDGVLGCLGRERGSRVTALQFDLGMLSDADSLGELVISHHRGE